MMFRLGEKGKGDTFLEDLLKKIPQAPSKL